MQEIFQKLENLSSSYIKIWQDVCNIESPTDCKEGIDKTSDYFAKMAKVKGWRVESLKQKNAGDVVCITLNYGAQAKPISLSGHIDTVHPVGSFGTPAVRIDTEKIYGPGVTDCKGGVVAAFMAMDALESCNFKKHPR